MIVVFSQVDVCILLGLCSKMHRIYFYCTCY